MAKRKQYYGIKFPFIVENNDEIFLDLNEDFIEKAKSEMYHAIFTPKGQRYRLPDFGTRLIDYIYDTNTEVTWDAVKDEITAVIELYVPSVTIKDVVVYKDENDSHSSYVTIKFTVTDGVRTTDVIEESIKI